MYKSEFKSNGHNRKNDREQIEMIREQTNNEEIVKKVNEIRVEGNWRKVVDRRRSGWKLYGEDTKICEVDRNKVEV